MGKGAPRRARSCNELDAARKRTSGSPGWTRTTNLRINSPALCRLSYRGPRSNAKRNISRWLSDLILGPQLHQIGVRLGDRVRIGEDPRLTTDGPGRRIIGGR